MAVLIEGISVVIRVDALTAVFASRQRDFKALVPNPTLCMDGELARVGFMTPVGARKFVEVLGTEGLHYLKDGKAQDLVVVDQQQGPMAPCDWLVVGHVMLNNGQGPRVTVAALHDSQLTEVVMPADWQFEGSLSQTFAFVPNDKLDSSMQFLRQENGMDVYHSTLTGTQMFTVDSRESNGWRR